MPFMIIQRLWKIDCPCKWRFRLPFIAVHLSQLALLERLQLGVHWMNGPHIYCWSRGQLSGFEGDRDCLLAKLRLVIPAEVGDQIAQFAPGG